MGLRLWHWVELVGHAVCFTFRWGTFSQYWRRERLRYARRGNGNTRSFSMVFLGFGTTLDRLAYRQAASPNRLFPDRICDLVVRGCPARVAYVFRNRGISELRE